MEYQNCPVLYKKLAKTFRGHQKLQLALQLHVLNKEVLGYDEPTNLRLEVDPSVFFGDLDGTGKQIIKSYCVVIVTQNLHPRGLNILLVVALQKRDTLQLMALIPSVWIRDVIDHEGIIVAVENGHVLLARFLLGSPDRKGTFPPNHHRFIGGVGMGAFNGFSFSSRTQ